MRSLSFRKNRMLFQNSYGERAVQRVFQRIDSLIEDRAQRHYKMVEGQTDFVKVEFNRFSEMWLNLFPEPFKYDSSVKMRIWNLFVCFNLCYKVKTTTNPRVFTVQ